MIVVGGSHQKSIAATRRNPRINRGLDRNMEIDGQLLI